MSIWIGGGGDGLIGTASDRRQTCDSRWTRRVEVGFRLPDLAQAPTDCSITNHDDIRIYCQSGVDFLTDLDFLNSAASKINIKYNLSFVIHLSLVILGTPRPAATSCLITQDF